MSCCKVLPYLGFFNPCILLDKKKLITRTSRFILLCMTKKKTVRNCGSECII